ncbi:lysine-2,3-aminomutase-like protein [Pseudotabrizicola alkalilacus]|uniref:Lysine-2,3-aminomutase-like protein n=1 Tax=Pseudotabrizicola alkalilacus TaxID=2305252 RepID=A0A411Z3P4_9RHOB|nr:lysine-2,3-aminomutase-like protein [Pseudotabrizicola alkalilacus]RGP37688.1 lysine-2,3-aminomutase-like protein [Pseudotabrizicola alkalilacus]
MDGNTPLRPAQTIPDLVADGLTLAEDTPVLTRVAQDFRLRLTPQMRAASQLSEGIARQFVPTAAELIERPEDRFDPIGDDTHAPVPGLTHRYPDRVILHVTKTCEVYCRFCFRRETVGDTGHLPPDQLEAAIAYIARTPAIWEVILTGGDPLVLSARRIADLVARLAAIPHVGVLRLHTRVPVVAPDRITGALIAALKQHPSVWVVVHTNHADELTDDARAALARLADAGIPLLSQSVLLRGVNDSAEALEALFRALIRLRVKPYYLHHCDLARGAGHFRTTIEEGQAIMAALRGRLSGTALPTYVLDIPGGYGKVPIGPEYLAQDPQGWTVTDPNGQPHRYEDPEPR